MNEQESASTVNYQNPNDPKQRLPGSGSRSGKEMLNCAENVTIQQNFANIQLSQSGGLLHLGPGLCVKTRLRQKQKNIVGEGTQVESEQFLLLISAAIRGQRKALNELIDLLTPVIQFRAARAVLKYFPAHSNIDVKSEVEDLTQEIFALLFQHQGKLLRQWQPSKGASLQNYVGLITQRRAINLLRSRKKIDAHEQQSEEAYLEISSVENPESTTISEHIFEALIKKLLPSLTQNGKQIFYLLFIKQLPIVDVSKMLDMNEQAVYAWKSRLREKSRTILKRLDISTN